MKVPLNKGWSPDLDPVTPGILTDSQWVFSTPKGWRGLELPAAAAPPLPSQCLGAQICNFGTGGLLVFLATDSQIYQWTTPSLGALGTLTAVSPTYYNPQDSNWSFDIYGQDILATNGSDPVQVWTHGSSTEFAPLTGNPPRSSIVVATDYGVFLILSRSNTWIYSFNDTIWSPGIQNQCVTNQISSTPGHIVAAKSLRGGIAFYKPYSCHFGYFIGPPNFWQINNVSEVVGTPGLNSVVQYKDLHYFVGPDDFYTFDGFSITPIPNDLKFTFFHTLLDRSYANQIQGQANPTRGQIAWRFPSVNANPEGTLDMMVKYSTLTGLWDITTQSAEAVLAGNEPTQGTGVHTGQLGLAYVDLNHTLQLLGEPPITSAPQPPLPISYITTADLGDKLKMYTISRICPSFADIPAVQPQNGIGLQVFSQYVRGQQQGLTAWPRVAFSQFGFFDSVTSDRLQRLKIDLLPRMTISDLDVEIRPSGKQ